MFIKIYHSFNLFFRKKNSADIPAEPDERKRYNKTTLIGGVLCGLALAAATSAQQFGVSMTSVGKAGFITALYIIIIPILGVFIRKKIRWIVWVCAGIAIVGFYLLCINESFSISSGDLLCLLCALLFSIQMILVDHFLAKSVDCILMSCVQFLTAGVAAGIFMFIFETPTWTALWDARISILYAGVCSGGIAYTLQIVGQKDTSPTVASLILSLESVFSVIGGWLILGERLSLKELIGCLLVFAAVILAQIPPPEKKNAD